MSQKNATLDHEILTILSLNSHGLYRGEIQDKLDLPINYKALQRTLIALANKGMITRTGERRATRYHSLRTKVDKIISLTPSSIICEPTIEDSKDDKTTSNTGFTELFSKNSLELLRFLETPVFARPKVSYNRKILENYVPNKTHYLPDNIRQELLDNGKRTEVGLAAGTYARKIFQQLLIELSYNSSRLEGNTYSKLDTHQLIKNNVTPAEKVDQETVMIINHKEAITFMVESAAEINPDTFTLCSLHQLLSQDLLVNPQACGRVRQVEINIGQSAYYPLDNPHQLQEILELLLLKARRINHPFEQSFFLLVHISYLQAFEDINKRTARLACNIPLIKANLCPLSFNDLPKKQYIQAVLLFYETNETQPLVELFRWSYLQSCKQYAVLKQSIGEIDGYRIQHRAQRKQVMGEIIRAGLHNDEIEKQLVNFCHQQAINSQDKFIAMTLTDLKLLHQGAIIGLGITQNQFVTWKTEENNLK